MSTAAAINRRADESTEDLMLTIKVVQWRRKEDNATLSVLLQAHDEDITRLWINR